MIYFYLYFLVPIFTALVHTGVAKRPLAAGQALQIWISHLFFWLVGVTGIFAFIVNSCGVMTDTVANEWLNWQAGTGWQVVLGWGYLAIGVAGVLAARLHGGFWLATALISVIWGVGEGIAALTQGVATQVWAYAIVYDFVAPAILLMLLWCYCRRVGSKAFCHVGSICCDKGSKGRK